MPQTRAVQRLVGRLGQPHRLHPGGVLSSAGALHRRAALYQLFVRDDITYLLPPLLSALAALCYLTATVGFIYRRRWTWWLSFGALAFETIMSLLVGTWSFIDPQLIGRTVWRHFGADYGYFPLIQPLLGLIWLLWPPTLRLYGFRLARPERSADPAAHQ